jgi:hypothetical protein
VLGGIFMAYGVERRRCRRFVIPSAEVKFKKRGLLFWTHEFSEPCSLINVSKGGIAFSCKTKLSKGKKLVVQLLIPDETSRSLNAIVRRQERTVGSKMMVTGVEFMPFGDRHGWNSLELLDALRMLERKYGDN